MPFFGHHRQSPPLLTASPEDLGRIGQTAFGGESVCPRGVSAVPIAELDGYVMVAIERSGASPGTPGWTAVNRQFLDELAAAAAAGGDWAYVGALCVGQDFVMSETKNDERYLGIVDHALEFLRTDGVSYTTLPPWALERWRSLHGTEGIHPAGWPSRVDDLPVPSDDAEFPLTELEVGESRKLAQAPAAPQNMIYAERRDAETIVAVVEGAGEDGQLTRWDWAGLSAPDYRSFLRELGERLVTHDYWAHDDLIPYFPCRERSRDVMRIEARAKSVPPTGKPA